MNTTPTLTEIVSYHSAIYVCNIISIFFLSMDTIFIFIYSILESRYELSMSFPSVKVYTGCHNVKAIEKERDIVNHSEGMKEKDQEKEGARSILSGPCKFNTC